MQEAGCRGGEGRDWVVLASSGVAFSWHAEGGVSGPCRESRPAAFVGTERSVGAEAGSGLLREASVAALARLAGSPVDRRDRQGPRCLPACVRRWSPLPFHLGCPVICLDQ